MAGRKVVDEADARECLEAAERSGLSRVAWARQAGIDARSLNLWKLNLERRSAGPLTDWLEIVSAPAPASGLRVHVGRCAVEVPVGFDVDTLRRVLQVLDAC